jgi:hypothetical protein
MSQQFPTPARSRLRASQRPCWDDGFSSGYESGSPSSVAGLQLFLRGDTASGCAVGKYYLRGLPERLKIRVPGVQFPLPVPLLKGAGVSDRGVQ